MGNGLRRGVSARVVPIGCDCRVGKPVTILDAGILALSAADNNHELKRRGKQKVTNRTRFYAQYSTAQMKERRTLTVTC